MINKKIPKKQLFEFGIIMGFCIPVIIGFLIPFFNGHNFQLWTLWLGLSFLIIGITNPKMLFYPYGLWIKIGKVLGWINNKLILGLVFIVVLIPISFFMRIIGYDPLRMRRNNNKETYREVNKSHIVNYEKIF
tara:strand:+ start:473 stop:871 length:399 start_codon:yes stop_codon:yes gene_type:complete